MTAMVTEGVPAGVSGLSPSSSVNIVVPVPTGVAATDTANLQAAANSVPSQGGTVQLQRGTYVINAAIQVNNPTTFVGQGRGGLTLLAPTVVQVASGSQDAFDVNAHGCSFRDFAIVCTATGATSGAGIKVTAGNGMTMRTMKIVGFFNDLDFDNGYGYEFDDVLFLDFVNYGARMRNTVNNDQGDGMFINPTFQQYNSTGQLGQVGLQWESGGGMKVYGIKCNGNTRTLAQSMIIGVRIAPADGVNTSDIQFIGGSIEGIDSAGNTVQLSQTGTGTGHLAHIQFLGVQHLNAGGVGMYCPVTAAGCISDVMVDNNDFQVATFPIYVKNIADFKVKPNRVTITQAGATVVQFDTGCPNNGFDAQILNSNSTATNPILLQDNSAASAPTTLQGTSTTYRRAIPSITSTVTAVEVFELAFVQFSSASIKLVIRANVGGSGAATYQAERAIAQSNVGGPTLTTINTDLAPAAGPVVTYDTATAGTLKINVKLPTGVGATSMFGDIELYAGGQIISVKQTN